MTASAKQIQEILHLALDPHGERNTPAVVDHEILIDSQRAGNPQLDVYDAYRVARWLMTTNGSPAGSQAYVNEQARIVDMSGRSLWRRLDGADTPVYIPPSAIVNRPGMVGQVLHNGVTYVIINEQPTFDATSSKPYEPLLTKDGVHVQLPVPPTSFEAADSLSVLRNSAVLSAPRVVYGEALQYMQLGVPSTVPNAADFDALASIGGLMIDVLGRFYYPVSKARQYKDQYVIITATFWR